LEFSEMMPDADQDQTSPRISGSAKGNIESIAQIEQAFVRQRSGVDRLGEKISRYAGSLGFAVAHVCGVSVWMAINARLTAMSPFDPYPFSFLGVLVGLEAVFLSTFVLMTQKRQARQAEHWAHLNLQIGLLSEQETTKMLQMLTMVCNRVGLKTSQDWELKEMVKKTPIAHLAQEMAQNLENPGQASETPPGETETA
jgi:uncharacterized membrane protein